MAPLERYVRSITDVSNEGAWAGHVDVSIADLARTLGVNTAQIRRYRQNGLTLRAADELAVRLCLHPALIWPDYYALPA